MGKEVSDAVVIEGKLGRDLSGNLKLLSSGVPPSFNQTGYYPGSNGNEGYRELAEDAFFKRGKREGDPVKYVCVPQEA